MKKLSLFLALLTALMSFASCGGTTETAEEAAETVTEAVEEAAEGAEEAAEEAAEEVVEEAAEAVEEVVEEVTETVEEASTELPAAEEETESGSYIEQMETWHYKTFMCPYTDGNGEVGGSTSGGYYEAADDEMAAYIAENPEWYKNTAEMETWDEADAPFGDCINSALAAETDWMTDTLNCNGIMFYKTFTVDKIDDSLFADLYCFYDNTFYLYINGEPFFISDGNCTVQDWNSSYELLSCNTGDKTLKDFLVEGENYIAASMKNAWGGREFDLYIEYEFSATKKTITYFDKNEEWHYSVYSCPYTDGEGTIDGDVSGGYFAEDTDEFAKYIATDGWKTDTATMSAWPTANAGFGSAADSIGWTGSTHGLIVYKTFTVDSVEDVKTCDDLIWYGDYDNAIHVYLNGTEIYTDDGECVVQDWQSNGEWTLDKDTVTGAMVDGENYIVVTIKDAWGGRDFNCGFKASWN